MNKFLRTVVTVALLGGAYFLFFHNAVPAGITSDFRGQNIGEKFWTESSGGTSLTIYGYAERIDASSGAVLKLDGKDDLLLGEGDGLDFGIGDFTLLLRVYLNSENGESVLIGKGFPGECCAPDRYPGFEMGLHNGLLYVKLEDKREGKQTVQLHTSTENLTDTWVDVTVQREKNEVRLIVNGELAERANLYDDYNFSNNYPMTVGGKESFKNRSKFFRGLIKRIALFDRALPLQELKHL